MYETMTDEAIADRLTRLRLNVRSFTPSERAELLDEAVKRILTADDRMRRFKLKVRDRAIAEADRRQWCGEFDAIIKQLGMAGRFAEYQVEFKMRDTPEMRLYKQRGYDYPETHTVKCLARDEEHARTLATNQIVRSWGTALYELTKVEVIGE